jgi:hypothetical protein
MIFLSRFIRFIPAILFSFAVLALPLTDTATAHNLNLGSTQSVSIDADSHWWTDVTVKTWNGYQYLAYWDAADVTTGKVYLAVARRNSATNAVSVARFDAANGNQYLDRSADGHNYVNIALSPVDGRIHVSWSHHVPPNDEKHYYGRSSAGCLSQATFSNCTFSFTNTGHSGGSSAQGQMTYPIYLNDQNNNLYFLYRCGSSLHGNEYMHSYNNDGTWTNIGIIIEGRKITSTPTVCDGTGGVGHGAQPFDVDGPRGANPSDERGVYVYGAAFDKNNHLHLAWGWREWITSWSGGFPTGWDGGWGQHGLYYAKSEDFGQNWKDTAGTLIGTAHTDPMHVEDSTLDTGMLPAGSWGGTSNVNLKVDAHNEPHLIVVRSDTVTTNAALLTYRNQHIWRTTDGIGGLGKGTWHSQYFTAAGQNTGSYTNFEFDGGDNIYHVGSINQHDWAPWNSDPYVLAELSPDRVTWQGGEYLDIQVSPVDQTYLLSGSVAGLLVSSGPNSTKQFRVRMKNNTAATQTSFAWEVGGTWYSQSFPISSNDTVYKDYTFTITAAGWSGTLGTIEWDPVSSGLGITTGSVSVDYIRLTNTAGTLAYAWEFQQGVKLVGAVGTAANNWANWETGIDLFPGLSITQGDTNWRFDKQRYRDTNWLSFALTEQGAPGVEKLTIRDIDISGDDEIIDWDFAVDTQGWSAVSHVSGFAWASDSGKGTIGGALSGNDSAVKSLDNLRVPIGNTDYIHIRLKNTTSSSTARVWFITEASGTYNTTKSKVFAITPNSNYTWYSINMSAVSGWSNQTLRQLRIDPSDDTGVLTTSFKIDQIYINDTP